MTNYVVGFLFTLPKNYVLLVQKLKPEWQLGLMNGIGGKIEEDESPKEAMIREFKEETGVKIDNWDLYHSIYFDSSATTVYFFRAFSDSESIFELDGKLNDVGEMMYLIRPTYLEEEICIENLHWLIPMAYRDMSYVGGESVGFVG